MRLDGRQANDLRRVELQTDFVKHPAGSVLVSFGRTKVLCNASQVGSVPAWMDGQRQGWVTAEYSMLPASTHTRKNRESNGRISGRTQEIQRLIGRSLRSVVDLGKMAGNSMYLDCDVVQADGGTRTASITGAYVALAIATQRLVSRGELPANPVIGQVAAVSVGLKRGEIFVDLDYEEDSQCDVDMNVVMTNQGQIVEVQATAEGVPFARKEHDRMLDAAAEAIERLVVKQRDAIDAALN